MNREEIEEILAEEPAYMGNIEDFMLDNPEANEELVREVMGLDVQEAGEPTAKPAEDSDSAYEESGDESDEDYVSDGASDGDLSDAADEEEEVVAHLEAGELERRTLAAERRMENTALLGEHNIVVNPKHLGALRNTPFQSIINRLKIQWCSNHTNFAAIMTLRRARRTRRIHDICIPALAIQRIAQYMGQPLARRTPPEEAGTPPEAPSPYYMTKEGDSFFLWNLCTGKKRTTSALTNVQMTPFRVSDEVQLEYADCFVYHEDPALAALKSVSYAAARMLPEEHLLKIGCRDLIRNRNDAGPLRNTNAVWSHLDLASAFARDLYRMGVLSHAASGMRNQTGMQTWFIGPSRIAGANQWNVQVHFPEIQITFGMNISTEEPKTLATIVEHMENDMRETEDGRRVWNALPVEMVREDHIVIGNNWGLDVGGSSLCEANPSLNATEVRNSVRLSFTRTPRVRVRFKCGNHRYLTSESPEMTVRALMVRHNLRPEDVLAMDGIDKDACTALVNREVRDFEIHGYYRVVDLGALIPPFVHPRPVQTKTEKFDVMERELLAKIRAIPGVRSATKIVSGNTKGALMIRVDRSMLPSFQCMAMALTFWMKLARMRESGAYSRLRVSTKYGGWRFFNFTTENRWRTTSHIMGFRPSDRAIRRTEYRVEKGWDVDYNAFKDDEEAFMRSLDALVPHIPHSQDDKYPFSSVNNQKFVQHLGTVLNTRNVYVTTRRSYDAEYMVYVNDPKTVRQANSFTRKLRSIGGWKNGDVIVDYGTPTVAHAMFKRPATGPYTHMLSVPINGQTMMKNRTITANALRRLMRNMDVSTEEGFTRMMRAFDKCSHKVRYEKFFQTWNCTFRQNTDKMVEFFTMYESHRREKGYGLWPKNPFHSGSFFENADKTKPFACSPLDNCTQQELPVVSRGKMRFGTYPHWRVNHSIMKSNQAYMLYRSVGFNAVSKEMTVQQMIDAYRASVAEEEDDDDDVEVVAVKSLDERLKERLEKAKRKGGVVDLSGEETAAKKAKE